MPLITDDTGFEPPPFDREVDLPIWVAACPREATTRGAFFEDVQTHVKSSGRFDESLYADLTTRRWIPFKAYPLRDFMRLCHRATQLVYPALPIGEGLRRLGWLSFASFAGTLAGKVVLYAFGNAIEGLILACPKAYALALPDAEVSIVKIAENHYRGVYRRMPNFAATYHVGVLEGAVRSCGFSPRVLVRRYPRHDEIDVDLRW